MRLNQILFSITNLLIAYMLPAQSDIYLDAATTYQTIDGWEVTPQAGQLEATNQYSQVVTQIWDRAVNELGINRVRLEIHSGAENPTDYFQQILDGTISVGQWISNYAYQISNDNANSSSINTSGFHFTEFDHWLNNGILEMKNRIEANGENLWINVCYVDFQGSAFEHYNDPDEYAEFVLAAYNYLNTNYGIIPDSWEVVLEPDLAAGWSAQQFADCISAAGDILVANGYTPYFVAPSTTDVANAVPYYTTAIATGNNQSYIKELSYHRYAGSSPSDLQNIATVAQTNGINTAHLEYIYANTNHLYDDLFYANVSSWSQFTLAWPTSGSADEFGKYYMLNDTDPANVILELANESHLFRQYFKYIRRGAVRIEASTADNSIRPLAFINADGNWVVVVKTDANAAFTLNDLPNGDYGINYSEAFGFGNADLDLPDQSVTNGTLTTNIPAQGVITIYGKNNTLSVDHTDVDELMMYPNPVAYGVSLFLNKTNNEDIEINITNLLGQHVLTLNGNLDRIDTSKIGKGIFMVEVSSKTKKILLEKIIIY